MAITLEGIIQTAVTTIFGGGVIGYLIHTFLTDYKETKGKVDTKMAKNDCKEWRDKENEKIDRVDDDLQQHKEGHS